MANVNLCSKHPSRISTMEFFAKIVNGLYKTAACARRPLLSGPKSGCLIQVWL